MYLYAIVALVSALLSGAGVWRIQSWHYQAAEKQRIEIEAKEQARKADRIDVAAAAHEKDKKEIEIRYRTVTKEVIREVEKPVYRNVCVGPDGVRNINDLIYSGSAGEPAGAVRPAGTPTERNR